MLAASICNSFQGIGLLDYAYLSLNVYQGKSDLPLLGLRPYKSKELSLFFDQVHHFNTWFQLDFPELHMPFDWGFYAEFYAKVYHGKVQHLLVSFRGTNNIVDWAEDFVSWGKSLLKGSGHHASLPSYSIAAVYALNCLQNIKQGIAGAASASRVA